MEIFEDTKLRAKLVINGAAEMSPDTRKHVAAWLRDHAEYLVEKGAEHPPVFIAGYLDQ